MDMNSTSSSSGRIECYVTSIPSAAIPYYWQIIKPMIELALAESRGELDSADVYERLCDQRMQALVAVDGDRIIATLVTEVVQYPKRLALRVVLAGGTGLEKWVRPAQKQLVLGARNIGATLLEMHGRRGWQKALLTVGWKPAYYSMTCEVEDGTD